MTTQAQNTMENQEFYFTVYDKEETYNEGECLTIFDTEDEARDFVIIENSGYGIAHH
jgi:hypothetical protein